VYIRDGEVGGCHIHIRDMHRTGHTRSLLNMYVRDIVSHLSRMKICTCMYRCESISLTYMYIHEHVCERYTVTSLTHEDRTGHARSLLNMYVRGILSRLSHMKRSVPNMYVKDILSHLSHMCKDLA